MSDDFSFNDMSLEGASSIRMPSSVLDETDDAEIDGPSSINHYNAADLVRSWTKAAPTTKSNSDGPSPPAEEQFVAQEKKDPLKGKYTTLIVVILVIVIISMVVAIAVIASRDSSSNDEEEPLPLTFPPSPTGTPEPSTLPPTPSTEPQLSPPPKTPQPSTSLNTLPPTPSRTPEPSPAPTTVPPTTAPFSLKPTTIAERELKDLLVGVSFDSGAALADPSSPQSLAFNWLLNDDNLQEYTDSRKIQRYVLATLYFSTDGDQWINNNGWLSDDRECDWEFSAGRDPCEFQDAVDVVVDVVDLRNNGLRGVLPPEIGLLSDSLLQIDLRGNFVFGSIPTELGFLENLRLLTLQDNDVSGSIPTEIGSLNLLRLVLDLNDITGDIPSEIGQLTRLVLLTLSQNRLVGPIATEIGLLVDLEILLVNDNDLNGVVPSELGELEELEVLDISNNNLNGSFPEEVCNLGIEETALDCQEVLCDCCGSSCLQEYLDKTGD